MAFVTHRGRRTAYHHSDRGAGGAPLCLVHGSGGERGVWKSQFRLADSYPVVAPDLSGHGDSEDVAAAAGYETLSAYADDTLAALEDVGHDPDDAVLVGSSMGGAVCLHLCLERDVTPRALVLAGSGARLPVMQALRDWLAPDGDFDRALEFLHAPSRLFADPEDRLRDVSAAAMRACGRAVVERDFVTCHRFDVRDRLDEVTVPALALFGEADALTPRRFHEELAAGLPDADLGVVEAAGHLAMLERPAAFNEALTHFLSERVEPT